MEQQQEQQDQQQQQQQQRRRRARHVIEAKADWRRLRRLVGQRAQEQMVGLDDKDVLLLDLLKGWEPHELAQPPRPIHNDEAVVALVAAPEVELAHEDRRDFVNEAVGAAAWGV